MRTQVITACLLALSVTACDAGKTTESECPECDCDCDQAAQGTPSAGDKEPATGSTQVADPSELSGLVASANRHMNHGRGKECLEALDEVEGLSEEMALHMQVVRGQCEMLTGKCQGGKSRISKWYVEEAAFSQERANTVAESIGSMRCRGGDSTDRDEILRALTELSDGAYMNKRSSKWCKERIDVVRSLKDKVTPEEYDDTQLSGGVQALFYTGAACFARAEDCSGALEVYREFFPKDGIKSLPPAEQTKIIDQSFKDSVQRCGD